MEAQANDPKAVNSHGHEIRPYYSTGIDLPLLIGVVDEFGIEHAYVSKMEWIEERNARVAEVAELKELAADMLLTLNFALQRKGPGSKYQSYYDRCKELGVIR